MTQEEKFLHDKALALAQVYTHTVEAIVKCLYEKNPTMAEELYIIIQTGIFEIAKIMSTPIPKYKK